MPRETVNITVERPGGGRAAGVGVSVELAGENGKRTRGFVSGVEIDGLHRLVTDDDGAASVDLWPNAEIDEPVGTVWKFTPRVDGKSDPIYVSVPSLTGGPFDVNDILADPPSVLPSTALNAEIAARIDADAALADDIADEVAARIAADATNSTAIATEATTRATAVAAEASARSTADALLIPLTQKAAANGVATLDSGGTIPAAQIPAVALSEFLGNTASQAAMLALVGQKGDWTVRTDTDPDTVFLLQTDDPSQLANWTEITTPGAVVSVNGRVGAVTGLAEAADLTAEIAARGAAVTAEATLARNASNLSSGTVADARIASTIARDSEVTAAVAAASALLLPLTGGVLTGDLEAPGFIATLTGTGGRFIGTLNGAPASGTWLAKDFGVDIANGCIWLCIVGGTPGTWTRIGSAGNETLSVEYSATDQTGINAAVDVTGLTGMQPTVGTRPQEILVKVAKCGPTSGTVPVGGSFNLLEDATIIDGVRVQSGALGSGGQIQAPLLFARRTAAQMTGKTYKVVFTPTSSTWSIFHTNVSSKASFKEV